jgi:hypothetical protein
MIMNLPVNDPNMHTETFAELLIFKTNIVDRTGVERLKSLFSGMPGIKNWNVDVQDIDHVLRIEARDIGPDEIIQVLRNAGYHCEELSD